MPLKSPVGICAVFAMTYGATMSYLVGSWHSTEARGFSHYMLGAQRRDRVLEECMQKTDGSSGSGTMMGESIKHTHFLITSFFLSVPRRRGACFPAPPRP